MSLPTLVVFRFLTCWRAQWVLRLTAVSLATAPDKLSWWSVVRIQLWICSINGKIKGCVGTNLTVWSCYKEEERGFICCFPWHAGRAYSIHNTNAQPAVLCFTRISAESLDWSRWPNACMSTNKPTRSVIIVWLLSIYQI